MSLALHLGSEGAEGIDHLRPRAVVQGEGEGGAGVAGRHFLGPAHLVLHLGGQLVGAADVADADVVVHHALDVVFQVAPEQAHEEVDFGAGAAEAVLQREGVESEPRQADAGGGFRDELHALGALLVAQESLE